MGNPHIEKLRSIPGNDHYKNRLIAILEHRLSEPFTGKKHGHHIIPKSWTGGVYDNTKTNVVKLSIREHFIVHKLMHKAFPEDWAMKNAFHCMCLTRREECKVSEKDWLAAKMGTIERNNINNPMNDISTRKKMVETRRARGSYDTGISHLTEVGRKSISERMKRKNPMVAYPDAKRRSVENSAKTRRTFAYWYKQFFLNIAKDNAENIVQDILNNISRLTIQKKYNLGIGFIKSCMARITPENLATLENGAICHK